jgi:DNA-binding NarL/FixJ family response regulator
MIRVAVVDDHPLFADGMVALLRDIGDIQPVGSAHTIADAVRLIDEGHPDVVLCDVLFGEDPDGLELPTLLSSSPPPAIVFLSQTVNSVLLNRAVAVGGSGYLLKTATAAEVKAAIVTVAAGLTAFPKAVFEAGREGAPPAPSAREAQIISLVAAGCTNSEVGAQLGISEKTVEAHLSRMFTRYGSASRTELAVLAERRGWLASAAGSVRR